MFCLIPDLSPYTVGIIARGEITKKDYEVTLVPALEKVAAEWQGINLLFVMETGFGDFTAGAWLEDIRTNAAYFLKWNKLAIVSNKETLAVVTRFFSVFIPGEARTFLPSELEEAKEWVSSP